ILALVRLRAFDTSTEAGRSQERYRRAILSAIASAAAKVISVLVQLITVPLTIGYLGDERYGLWMTISSLVAMLGRLTPGSGAGLVGAMAKTDGIQHAPLARRFVSGAMVSLSAVAILLIIFSAVAYPFLPWAKILNVNTPNVVVDGARAALTLMICF